MKKQLYLFCSTLMISFSMIAQWMPTTQYPGAPTDGAFSVVHSGKAYVGGGLSDNHFYRFDPTTEQWHQLANVPGLGNVKTWAFSFVIADTIYVCGGAYATASNLENGLYAYDINSNIWAQKEDFPGGERDGGYGFSINGKGYVGGGFDGQFLNNDLYEYNPVTNQWTQMADFPGSNIIFPVAFVVNSIAYVGIGDVGGGNETVQLWAFDPSVNTWTAKANFPGLPRQTAISYVVGNYAIVGGGMSGYTTSRTDFWLYNTVNDNWNSVPNTNFPNNFTAWSSGFILDTTLYYGLGVDLPGGFILTNNFFKNDLSNYLSVEKRSEQSPGLRVFPNPSTHEIFISTGNTTAHSIEIINLLGKRVMHNVVDETQNSINIQELKSGMYFIHVFTDKGEFIQKFQKL